MKGDKLHLRLLCFVGETRLLKFNVHVPMLRQWGFILVWACLLLPFRIIVLLFLQSPTIVLHIPISLRVCDIISNIALTLRVLGRHNFRSVRKTEGKENREFLHDKEVNRFGRYIKIFFILGNKQNGWKTESGKYPRWAQPTGARLAFPPGSLSWKFLIFLNFQIFQNWQKIFLRIFQSLFTYRITYLPFFMILGCSGRFPLCVLPVSKFG